jgi:citrate lyase beta subunit
MSQLEKAVTEADKIESRLNLYCDALQHIQHSMEKMGEKNTLIQIAGRNNQVLLQELENIVVS